MDLLYNSKRTKASVGTPNALMKHFVLLFLFSVGFSLLAQAQTTAVSGTVPDSHKEPLPGVSIKVKGSEAGTSTDVDGKFNIRVPANAVLVFSYVGFKPTEVKVGQRTTLSVVLQEDATTLQEVEVVAIGYGNQKKSTLTGSVATVSSAEILKSPTASPTNSLIGKLPGLQATQTSGQPGADAASIKIRGVATFDQNSEAIVVVDGIERPSFADVDPNEIETVTILKDAASTAVYGIKGANGVIVITTKAGKLGKPRINYTGNMGLQTYTGIPVGLNAHDNAFLLNEAYKNDGKPEPFTAEELTKFADGSDPLGYPNVQWFDYLTRKYYPQTNHNISVSGGTKIA